MAEVNDNGSIQLFEDQKIRTAWDQAVVSVKQRQRPDSSRGLFVHIMVRTVGRTCCSTPLLRKIKNDLKPELEVISGWRSP